MKAIIKILSHKYCCFVIKMKNTKGHRHTSSLALIIDDDETNIYIYTSIQFIF